MSSKAPQSYESHRRLHPLYHLVIAPLFGINVIVAIVVAVRYFSWIAVWNAVMAVALFFLTLIVRFYATKNQDRIIRVEETVRLYRVLPPDLRPRIEELRTGQLVAMRFCADEELPELMRAILSGEVRGRENIKRRIKNWRADDQRV